MIRKSVQRLSEKIIRKNENPSAIVHPEVIAL
jgi:hypothetical protein